MILNDKTESWNGFVYLYRDERWGVAPFVGRIPVQIKSTKHPFIGDTASISIKTADLRNYCTEGVAMLFLINLDTDTDTNHFFYASLLKECVNKILCTKPSQKEVSIVLQRLPENQPNEMERIFHSFLSERNLSANPNSQQSESQIASESQNMFVQNDIISKTDDLLKCLNSGLKKYILQKIEWYKTQNIAVQTPQLLLMLPTYPNNLGFLYYYGYALLLDGQITKARHPLHILYYHCQKVRKRNHDGNGRMLYPAQTIAMYSFMYAYIVGDFSVALKNLNEFNKQLRCRFHHTAFL